MENFYKHPTALVESEDISEGTKIWAFAHILKGAVIGSNCNIGDHCYIESGVTIGNNVTIKNGTAIWEGVVIGDNVFIGPNVVFTNDLFPRSSRLPLVAKKYSTKSWCAATMVLIGASLGANSTILCGKTIGEYAMVGAGSIVTQDVPAFSLAYGNPARVKGYVCKCSIPLKFRGSKAVCKNCSAQYHKVQNDIVEVASH